MPPLCTPEKRPPKDEATANDYHSRKILNLRTDLPDLFEHFNVHSQVGEGTFSSVYVATLKNNRTKKYAIKHMVRTCHPDRIRIELECLKVIGGVDNVVGIDFCLRNGDNVAFIMPYLKHQHFNSYVGKMDAKETAVYMKNLLTAVARVHEFNIIHRDVKPSNFLYDREKGKFLLVDFGLAQKVNPQENIKQLNILPEAKRKVLNDKKSGNELVVKTSPRTSLEKNEGVSQKENFPVESAKMYRKEAEVSISVPKSVDVTSPKPELSQPKFTQSSSIIVKVPQRTNCSCYGKPRTCSICLSYKPQNASRAGTPGFRPPEVLLKSQEQTTAVDVWACGIILLSILSGRSNFFSNPDDITALAEMVTLFGYEAIKKVASQCGQYFITSERKKPLDLRKICCVLRSHKNLNSKEFSKIKCVNCLQPNNYCVCLGTMMNKNVEDEFPKQAYDLLKRLLDVNPNSRITARQALEHDFLHA